MHLGVYEDFSAFFFILAIGFDSEVHIFLHL